VRRCQEILVFEIPSVQWRCGLKVSAESQFLGRFERSEAIERLERLERTDPVLNGAKRLNDWNIWNGLRLPERRFQHEKAAPKLLNRAYSKLFFSQINALRCATRGLVR
jgi:hypothetical protein